MPEGGVEILFKEINRLHDVHIAVGRTDIPLSYRPPSTPDFCAVSYKRSRDRDQLTVAPIGPTFQQSKMMEIPGWGSQQEIGRNEVPAKFEQGGFTSGRRKGPKTLFPGTSPGNPSRRWPPPQTFGDA